jgi:hypothetical protein
LGRIFRGITGWGACAAAAALLGASCDGSDDPATSHGGSGGVSADAPTAGNAGSGGGSATDGVREACLAWCEKQAQAACSGGTPREGCPQQCDLVVPQISCPKEYAGTRECIETKAKFGCLTEGRVELYGCWTELQPYLVCSACQPASSDDACDTCEKTSCCEQLKAYWGHPEFGPYLDCASLCAERDAGLDAGVTCLQSCAARYPNLRTVGTALGECRATCRATCPI